MKKILLSAFVVASIQLNAQVSVNISNADTTIVAGASVNLNTTAVYPPYYGNSGNFETVANAYVPDGDIVTGLSSSYTVNIPQLPGLTANFLQSVTVNIYSTWNADLDLYLVAPDGSQIELSTDNGGGGDHYTNCVFTIDPNDPSITTAGTSGVTGNFAPEQPFSNLTGNANGTWTLKVYDDASDDVAQLLNWAISFPANSNTVTYEWSPATGLNNPFLSNPIATPTQTTTYTVTMLDELGGVATDQITITVNGTAAIEEQNFSNFNVFPNPASSNVSINNLKIGSTLQLTDMTGKIVFETIVSTEEMNIDLAPMNNGIYFIQIMNNSEISGAKKLVVNK